MVLEMVSNVFKGRGVKRLLALLGVELLSQNTHTHTHEK